MTALTAKLTSWWRSREDDLGDVWPFLLVANVLYLFRIGAAPLWYDEAVSAWFAQIPLARMIIGTASDTHPPLYYLLLSPIGHLYNWSPIVLRLPSALFALLTLYLVRQIARELHLSQAAQTIALALMVLSPFQLHFAQEARMYALLQALVLAATLAALRKQMLRFALLSAAALWTHNYGLFYLVVNCGVLAWVVWRTKPRMAIFETGMIVAIVGGSAFALWTPWAWVLYQQMRLVATGYWIMPVSPGSTVNAIVNLMYAFTIPPWLAPMGVIVAVGWIAWLMLKTIQARAPEAWLLAWMVLAPALLAVIISIVWKPILLFRGLAPSLPALFLLSGWAFARLPRARQLYAAILIVPLFVAAIIGQYLWTPDQKSAEDQRVLDAVRAGWQPGDIIIHSNAGYLVEWHPRGADLRQIILPRTCPLGNPGDISPQTRAALGMVDADPEALQWRRAWFVYLIMPTITQCDADMAQAFLDAHPNRRLAFAIQGDELVEANIWLVTR